MPGSQLARTYAYPQSLKLHGIGSQATAAWSDCADIQPSPQYPSRTALGARNPGARSSGEPIQLLAGLLSHLGACRAPETPVPQIEDSVTLTQIWYSPQAALVRTTCVFCLRSRGQTCPTRPKLSQVAHSGLEEGVGQGDHKGRKLCEYPCVTKCVTPGSRDRVGGRSGEWPGRRLMEDRNSLTVSIQRRQSRPSRLCEGCSALLCCSRQLAASPVKLYPQVRAAVGSREPRAGAGRGTAAGAKGNARSL